MADGDDGLGGGLDGRRALAGGEQHRRHPGQVQGEHLQRLGHQHQPRVDDVGVTCRRTDRPTAVSWGGG